MSKFRLRIARQLLLAAVVCSGWSAARTARAEPPPLHALIVGGGPDVESNAAQIEGHVHFVAGMLPKTANRLVLFTDGKTDRATVSYADPSVAADAKRALAILLADNAAAEPLLTRAPDLGVPVDGPSRLQDFRRVLGKLSAQVEKEPAPVLLYFAGHGSRKRNDADTEYDMWDGDTLRVRTLATEIARLPRASPIVLVMAQCYSGAFANLIFRGADPKGTLIEHNLAGFFSTTKDREAAGCSYETGQKDYQDFSSYFFGALCGHDRFGGMIKGADFDGSGTVSLHEAFCYALVNDRSADIPVCTSEVFLKRYGSLPEASIYGTPYQETWQAATAGQRAALDALSEQLGLTGEKRALAVFDRLTFDDPAARPALVDGQNEAKAALNVLRQTTLSPMFERWPALRWSRSSYSKKAFDGATKELGENKALARKLIDAVKTHQHADEAVENEEAALQRFAGLYEQVLQARDLREHGKEESKAQFERLWKAEQATLPTAALR